MLSAIWPRLPPLTTLHFFGGNTMNDYLSLMEQARQAEDFARLENRRAALHSGQWPLVKKPERCASAAKAEPTAAYRLCERNARTVKFKTASYGGFFWLGGWYSAFPQCSPPQYRIRPGFPHVRMAFRAGVFCPV